MAEKRKLIERRQVLEEELARIEKKLHEIELVEKTKHPYYAFTKKYEKELGVRTRRVSLRIITSPIQKDRIRLMEYLIKHGHTSENPISYHFLSNNLGVKNMASILGIRSKSAYSPLYGGLKVVGENIDDFYDKRINVDKLYIEDMKKAKTYVALMKELVKLPKNI